MKKVLIIASSLAVTVLVVAIGAGVATGSVGGINGKYKTGCTPCHGLEESPLGAVVVSGPATLAPGQKGTYTVTMAALPPGPVGGMNAAVEDGSASKVGKMFAGTNTSVKSWEPKEVTHSAGAPVVGKAVTGRVFTFDWQAPATPGSYRMYVVTMAGNGNGGYDNTLPAGVGDAWFKYRDVNGQEGFAVDVQ